MAVLLSSIVGNSLSSYSTLFNANYACERILNPSFCLMKRKKNLRIQISYAISDGSEKRFSSPRPNVSIPWQDRSIIMPNFIEDEIETKEIPEKRHDDAIVDDAFIEDEKLFKQEYKPLTPTPHPSNRKNKAKEEEEVFVKESLIPEKWRTIQTEMNKPKKEKKREYLVSIMGKKKEMTMIRNSNLNSNEFNNALLNSSDKESTTSMKSVIDDLIPPSPSPSPSSPSPSSPVTTSTRFPPLDPFLSSNSKGAKPLDDILKSKNISFNRMDADENIFDEDEDEEGEEEDWLNERKHSLSYNLSIKEKEKEGKTNVKSDEELEESEEEGEGEREEWIALDEAEEIADYEEDFIRASQHRFASSVDFSAKRILKSKALTSQKWKLSHSLSATGQKLILSVLVKNGLDLEEKDKDGYTMLQKALMNGREAMAKTLIRLGANSRIIDHDGASLLHYCAQNGSTQVARILVKSSGIDVNIVDNIGWTPLHIAVQSGRLDMVNTMLLLGGNPKIKNNDGNSSFDIAAEFGPQFGFPSILAALKNPKTLIPDQRLMKKKKRVQRTRFSRK